VVRRPAKVDVFESQSGAETIPTSASCQHSISKWREYTEELTILEEDREALLDEKIGVEDYESK